MNQALTVQTAKPNGFGMLISPESLDAAKELANILSKSELVPKAFANKPNDILIAGAMGHRLGLDLFSALAGIAVVNGRPTLYGDAMLATCQSRPDFEDISEVVSGEGDKMLATVTVKRAGRSAYVSTYSMDDAAKAGLKGKQGPWSQHPKRMLTMRARSFALRGAFADALSGFHCREEMEDANLVDVTASATVIPDAKPAKRRKIEDIPESTAQVVTPTDAPSPAPVADNVAADSEPEVLRAESNQEITIEQCRTELHALWKSGEDGKVAAKAIMKERKFDNVDALKDKSQAERKSFIDDVRAAGAA